MLLVAAKREHISRLEQIGRSPNVHLDAAPFTSCVFSRPCGVRNPHGEERLSQARSFVESVRGSEGFEDIDAWAVTGSVARGNASAGSDVELVALVPNARPSEQFIFEGELLTLFYLSLSQLSEMSFLASIDAECFALLEDPQGELAAVRQYAQASLQRMLRESKSHCQKQLLFIEDRLLELDEATYESLSAHHKRAQTILWWAGLKQGLRRVQKVRHQRQRFGDEVSSLFLKASNLEFDVALLEKEIKAQWPSILKARSRQGVPSALHFAHTTMLQKWRAHEGPDGALAARDFFKASLQKTPADLAALKLFLFTGKGSAHGSLSNEERDLYLKSACTKSADAQYELFELVK